MNIGTCFNQNISQRNLGTYILGLSGRLTESKSHIVELRPDKLLLFGSWTNDAINARLVTRGMDELGIDELGIDELGADHPRWVEPHVDK